MTAYQYDWNLLPIGQLLWLKELESYNKFPPLQAPESYNLSSIYEEVKKEADVKRMEEVERYGAVVIPESDEAVKTREAEARLKEVIGMTLASGGAEPKVSGIGSGMPAAEAGIKKDDLLVSVWGRLTGYMPLADVMKILLDKSSLEIKCTIERVVDVGTRRSFDIKKVIGASLAMEFDGLTVSSVEDGGPAFAAARRI